MVCTVPYKKEVGVYSSTQEGSGGAARFQEEGVGVYKIHTRRKLVLYTVPYKRPVATLMKLLKKKMKAANQVKGANTCFMAMMATVTMISGTMFRAVQKS